MTDKLIEQLRDEDSYYRVQEKHWCIDAEELERQRQAAADRIEAQAAEIERLNAVVDALLQHDASTFWGPDGEKNKRASYRGVIRKAKKARAALGEKK